MYGLTSINSASVKDSMLLDSRSAIEAIGVLDRAPVSAKFVLVINENNELVGTISDGDIRRGLMRGVDINGPISLFMHRQPRCLSAKYDAAAVEAALNDVKSPFPFLPVLDDARRVIDVLAQIDETTSEAVALIMAGGFGTRLGERTKLQPKPLIDVDGKPLLEYVLQQLENSSIKKIYISTFYLGEQILQYLKDTSRDKDVVVLKEETPLGTAGSLGLVPCEAYDKLIITNADVLTDLSFDSILKFQGAHKKFASIAVAEHQVQIPFGVIKHDANGNLLSINEKPLVKNFVAAGIYCFPASVTSLLRCKEKIDMPELISRMIDEGYEIKTFPIHEYWIDVGTPEDLAKVAQNYKI